MNITKKDVLYFVRIVGVLLIISMCVASLLALVNDLTKDKIAENDRETLNNAVGSVFAADNLVTQKTDLTLDDNTFVEFCIVKSGETTLGYYAEVAPKGFKGAVEMLIGIDLNGNVCGIEIISSSETPGIGDKIQSSEHLAKFIGKNASSNNFDTISGATYSSKAVINGTKTALAAYEKYIAEVVR